MALGNRAALRLVAAPFCCGKAVTLAIVLLAALQHRGAQGSPSWEELRATAFAQWDSQSYVTIATHGYPGNVDTAAGAPAHVWAFLPGYPMLIAATAVLIRDAVVAGVIVSAVGELVALVALARWVSLERNRDAALTAAWLFAVFPYALFLSVVYTESAFLAAALVSILLMRQGRHTGACIAAALACAMRVTGLALIPALLIEYGIRRRGRADPSLASILLVPLPLALFGLYAWVHAGDALAFLHIQSSPSFHRALTFPLSGLRETYGLATASWAPGSFNYLFTVELVAGLLGLVAVVVMLATSRVPRSLSAYAAAVWLLAVSQPYWLSVPRYLLAMVPFLLIATDILGRKSELRTAVLVAFASGLGYLSTLWAQGTFVG